ncbi:MAG TPA: mechanosensitive ion channel family protein, partial [Syntrophorhabdaceae bacterium]|nr:mechanosensitive ion channel family protein [Syntrophorhabdaceae bacterium]HOL06334.1 mechanosensitive ion channel family protein [Syntrophorhabdaceae bacterium]HPP42699.1 mechanosensitive ion channel family protein [Syntrophorhabdaceae bacterium]
MNILNLESFLQRAIEWLLTNGLHILIVIILAWLSLKLTKKVSERFLNFIIRQKDDVEFQKRTHTLGTIIRYVLIFAIIAIASMTVLKELGINIGPILAAAGIVGLAVGFGAQSLVKDVISGFFIILEDQIRVGDVVEIAGKSGLVEKINLKTTVLRDMAGNVHCVPNGLIQVVTNMTKEYSRYVFDIGIAYKEDVDRVIEVIKEIDEDMRNDPDFKNDIIEPIEILGLDQFASSSVIIKARTTTLPIKQWRVGREFNKRLKKRFDELGIEIPFPHVTLFMGTDKKGNQPPIKIIKE